MLIDTIVNQYPLPAIVLARRKTEDGKTVLDVIDGKQRIETILLYLGELKGAERVEDWEKVWKFAASLSVDRDEEKKMKLKWVDIGPDTQEAFWEYKIPVVEICGNDMEYIRDVFVRVNTTGNALSRAEIRNARFFDDVFMNSMRDFTKEMRNKMVRMGVFSVGDGVRMRDIEFLSELVLSVHEEKLLDKKKAISKIMETTRFKLKDIEDAQKRIKWAIQFAFDVLPEIKTMTHFRKFPGFYSLVLLFDWMRIEGFALENDKSKSNARILLEKFSRQVSKAWNSEDVPKLAKDYLNTVREGGDKVRHRERREEILLKVLEGVFCKKDETRFFTPAQREIIWGSSDEKRCCVCGRKLEWSDFEVDHVVPWSKGGKTELSNAALICKRDNARKGNR